MIFRIFSQTLLITLLSLGIFSSAYAQLWTPEKKQQVVQYLDDIRSDTAGLAVGVVYNGKVVYKDYMGLANLEHQVKVSAKTKFNIASNAKQFTALCILKLAIEGKLNLQDDIRKYLPKLYPDIATPITLEQLLNHTSGIRTSEELLGLQNKTWWQIVGLSNRYIVRMTEKQKTLSFTPGTEFLYSNTNYILLTEVVKKITGKKFSQYAHKLFEDLGMKQTVFKTRYMAVIPHQAEAFGKWGKNWSIEPGVVKAHGDGNLFTTLSDQLRWEQLVQKPSLLPQWNKIIQKSQLPIEGSKYQKYGYGLNFGTYKGVVCRHHYGQTAAYGATFLRFPKQGLTIVAMSNTRNLHDEQVADKLVDIIFGKEVAQRGRYNTKPKKINRKSRALKDLTGYYQSEEDGNVIKITTKDNQLYRELYQRKPVKMILEKGDLYRYSNSKVLKMNFSPNKGQPTHFTLYHPEISPRMYKKVPGFKPAADYYQTIQGNFYNDELGVGLKLSHQKDNQYTLTFSSDQRPRKAALIYKDYLQAGGYYIALLRDSKGVIEEIRLRVGRIKNVRFVKQVK